MLKNILLIFVFLILQLSYPLPALEPAKALSQYMVASWDDEKGLPQNSVHAVIQTYDGYLWFGTEEGLARFDGIEFREFNENNTAEIKNNYVSCLFEDKKKNLWIGSRGGGLLRFRNGKFKHFGEKDGLTNEFITAIKEDEKNNFWIGTDRGGLFRLKNGQFSSYTTEHGLPVNIIKNIFPGSKGILWVATIKGLCFFKDNKFTNISGWGGLPEIHINSLYEDRQNNLWVGTEKGLYKGEGGRFSKCKLNADSAGNNIRVIFADSKQNLWFGTASSGIARYNSKSGKFSFLSKKDGLSGNTIRSITEDREGSLWVGTALGGVNCLRDGKFTTFGVREGLSDDVVFSIYEDCNNILWIGTNNGLNRFENGKFFHYNTKNGLSNNVISAVTRDSKGHIWVGTDDGLNRLQETKSKIPKIKAYLRNEYLLAVLADKAGNLWAGTLRGLYRKGSDQEEFIQIKGLASKVINFIYEDSSADLWISTLRKGLMRYRDGEFTLFSTQNGLVSNSLNCIYEDDEGVLWIGTINGLSRYKDGKFVNYTRKQGLYNNNIYQILEDSRENLWMSCNKGIFGVNKKDLNDIAENKVGRLVATVYGRYDGMRSSECNGGYQSAGCKTKDGKLWFPTTKGIVCVDPGNIKLNKIPPPVFIEQILLDGIPVDSRERVIIKPGTKRVEFFYTAPTFINPDRVKYKYRLSGYEDKWIHAGKQRIALYTNLDPGKYRFDLRACNSDGIWNEKGAALYLKVIPPFWSTWWFVLFCLTAFAAVSYLVINFFRNYFTLSEFWKKQKLVGQYKLLDEIGTGGMGTIYKAKNITDKREIVAIKVLKKDLFKDERNRKRFKQEAAIVDQLDHPHIVKIFERGESKQNSYIAMELLEGKSLAQKIAECDKGKMDLKESLEIMIQVVDALRKIHSKNIVHRDLKPENIMLINNNGNPNFVKLLDFGLAWTEHQSRLTRTGAIVGTINYLSPEQIGHSEFSPASDIYSSGVIFYEMLTGLDPFCGETTIEIMKQIINETPVEPAFFRPGIPRELNELVLSMLSKDKSYRPTAEEVLAALSGLLRTHFATDGHRQTQDKKKHP